MQFKSLDNTGSGAIATVRRTMDRSPRLNAGASRGGRHGGQGWKARVPGPAPGARTIAAAELRAAEPEARRGAADARLGQAPVHQRRRLPRRLEACARP